LFHHTHWNLLSNEIDFETRITANLLFLSDRIDALRIQIGSESQSQQASIRDTIRNYSGSMFAPELVDAFLEIATADSFWFYMESEALKGYFDEWIAEGEEKTVGFDELKSIAMMFAKVVDAKSSFTSIHTFGVASLARYLSQAYGMSLESQEKIELSAFFHDLGKLRVADSILHKNGPLNEEERVQMNRHGFDSHVILQKIRGFQEIAKIASIHHETLDAQGYPFHLHAEAIPIEARILAVADIFQALVQNRPYRVGLTAHQAYHILSGMVDAHKIDASVVEVVHAHLEECYEHAMKPDPFHAETNNTAKGE
jgi:HD-GYP domain-containing protein (c-di-GMP phosphodiesterase class II)